MLSELICATLLRGQCGACVKIGVLPLKSPGGSVIGSIHGSEPVDIELTILDEDRINTAANWDVSSYARQYNPREAVS